MIFNQIDELWAKTPFGATSVETPPETPQPPPVVQTPPDNTPQNKDEKKDEDEDDPYAGLSAKELKRMLADAEKANSATASEKKVLQDKVDAEQRAKNDETTNLKNDLQTEKDTNTELRQALSTQAKINAILQDDRFTWHNIDDVISKLPESVTVDEKGKVTGLTTALTKIAKDSDYLLKTYKDAQGNHVSTQQQNNQQNNNGPTGFQPGQGGVNSGGGMPPNAAELAKSYPALASRMGMVPQIPVPQAIPGMQ